MEQEPYEQDNQFTTRKEVLSDWIVFTTTDPSGVIIKRVGFPKIPLLREEDLRASLEDDELYSPDPA